MPARGSGGNNCFDRFVDARCVDPLCRSATRVTKGMSMFLRNIGRASSVSNDEGQTASTGGARANVLRLSGPCGRWDERDADFIREILDLVGDKWSMLVIGALAAGDARYSDLDTTIPAISRHMLTLTLKTPAAQRAGRPCCPTRRCRLASSIPSPNSAHPCSQPSSSWLPGAPNSEPRYNATKAPTT